MADLSDSLAARLGAIPRRDTSAFRSDPNRWASELGNIELDELRSVRIFAARYNSSVSLVHLDRHRDAYFALKTIKKRDLKDDVEDQKMVMSEREVLIKSQPSGFTLRLYRTFRDMRALYLLTEFLPGGELSDLGAVSEDHAKFYLGCVAEAIDYLHTRHMVHNDVSTANLVLDADGYVKLVDFGCAIQLEEGQRSMDDMCGTPEYLPPEVALLGVEDGDDLEGRDRGCDLWAMGIVLYELLTGRNPFNPTNALEEHEIFQSILEGIDTLEFPREKFSEEAEDLIRNLCTYDSVFRLGYQTIDEIREHRWYNGFDWEKLRERKLAPPMVPELKSIEEMHDFTPDVSDTDSDVEEEESEWDKAYQDR